MGQQQLLLILLGMIIIAFAIVVGVTIFRQQSIEQKRDSVISELIVLGSNAQQFYWKPKELNGGNKSFENWVLPRNMTTTLNGRYEYDVSPERVELTGIGNEVVVGTDSVEVKLIVYPTIMETIVIR